MAWCEARGLNYATARVTSKKLRKMRRQKCAKLRKKCAEKICADCTKAERKISGKKPVFDAGLNEGDAEEFSFCPMNSAFLTSRLSLRCLLLRVKADSQVTQCYDSPPVQAGFFGGEYGSKNFRCTERRHRKTGQNCTIQLKAKRNSTTVVVNTWHLKIRMKPGVTVWTLSTVIQRYSVGGRIPAVTCRDHHSYEDSRPGTLNDFLGAMTEDEPVRRHCAVLS